MQNTKTLANHLLETIQTAAQSLTKEMHALGAVGIWETIRRRAERGALVEMLDITNGNMSEAALRLGVNRNTLANRADQFSVDPQHPENARTYSLLPDRTEWKAVDADIIITITARPQRGGTTTGYLLAQTLKQAGWEVEISEAYGDNSNLKPTSTTDVDRWKLPDDLQPRSAHIRVGGAA